MMARAMSACRLPALVAGLLLIPACATEPVRLYELREAPPGTPEAMAWQRLEQAVALVNEFLQTSPSAAVFPAESATFSLDHTDILVHYRGEGVEAIRLEATRWSDPRTLFSGFTTGEHGILTPPGGRVSESGDEPYDVAFLELPPEEMAAVLLRLATERRVEELAGGSLDLGVPGDVASDGEAPGDRPALVEYAFRKWLAETRGAPPARRS